MKTQTGLTHRYRPRGSARELFAARDPEVLISGPAGTGKSRACMEKLNAAMLANPGSRALIVRKTLASLGSTALETWRRHVVPELIAANQVGFYGGSAAEPAQYRYANRSVVVVGGMDKSTRIMSSEYDMIYVQEATELTVEDWEALTTRLRNWNMSFQQLIADCNPSVPTHWLKQRADAGRTRIMYASHSENPILWGDDGPTEQGKAYLAKLDALTGVRRQRLKDGLWVAAEGLIYDSFDPAVHLVERPENMDDWPRWWSVDFGYTNPFVLQCWAEAPDGALYMYREIYRTRRTVDEHAATILDRVSFGSDGDRPADRAWIEPKPREIICDHDAEGRATLERALGLATRPADKRVSEGIQSVQRRIRDARLFVCRGAAWDRDADLIEARRPASTEEEIPGYIWDTGAGKAPKEAPVKADDHGCDAMRYLVQRIDGQKEARVRWVG